jgi:hypothetical protein
MRGSRIVVVWVGLFAATLGVRKMFAAPPHHASQGRGAGIGWGSDEETLLRDAMEDLESRPRQSALGASSAPGDEEYPAATGDINSAITSHIKSNELIRMCRIGVMMRSARPSEYFEISFRVNRTGIINDKTPIQDVVLERSSVDITPLEGRCIETAFHGISVPNQPFSATEIAGPRRAHPGNGWVSVETA